MTERVNPSHMHTTWADESAAAIEKGGGITGYVVDGVMLSDDDPDLDSAGVNAFDASYSGNTLTVDGGEAFVHGTWAAIDVTTNVTIDTDATVVGVGWMNSEVSAGRNTITQDDVFIQNVEAFDHDGQYIPLWRVSFDSGAGTITGVEDLRLLQRPIYNDFEGNVYMPYGDLDMNGHNVINTGNLIEGDEDLFVNRSGDDMFGPLEITGQTPGSTSTPLVLRNDSTDSGTSTEIQLINSTSTTETRGSSIRSERASDGGSELFFGIGDGSTMYESTSVNTEGIYSDAFQTGNVSIEDDDTFKYNSTDYMSFDADGLTTHEYLHVNRLVPINEVMIDSDRANYRLAAQGDDVLELANYSIISHQPHYMWDRVEIRNNGDVTYPQMTFENDADGHNVNMTVTISDETLGDGVFHFSNGTDPANSVIELNAVTGEALFDGDVTVNAELQMGSNAIRMETIGGEGGLSIDRNVYYSSFEGWATIYNNSTRGGVGWRMRDIEGAGTVFQMNSAGEAVFTNKLSVGQEFVLPKRTSRPSNPEVGTIIYRVDKDN